jgi:hypothetical protein
VVRKIDSIAGTTRLYFYNDKWQVLTETDASETMKAWYAYGNYIDEVLLTCHVNYAVLTRYYVHDHLYSPAAMTTGSRTVLERYEYDAYGNPYVLEPNFADDPDGKTDWANPYYFQGKRLDVLDGNGLELMSWPYRDYSTYLGRWLEHDKLGMMPNDHVGMNRFGALQQYRDGENLYQAFLSRPPVMVDVYGLLGCCSYEPFWEPQDSWDGYDWWQPADPVSGIVTCQKPCKWRNLRDTRTRSSNYACYSASAEIPAASGCGAAIAIGTAIYKAIHPRFRSVTVCNRDISWAAINDTCICRLTLSRRCKRKCCDHHRHWFWQRTKTIHKYYGAKGKVMLYLGGPLKICSCDYVEQILSIPPGSRIALLNNELDCRRDL